MFRIEILENIKINVTFNNGVFSKSCHLRDKLENVTQPDRPQMTIRRLRIACYITMATDTHTDYAILTAFHGESA